MKYIVLIGLLALGACVKSKNEACPSTPQYQVLSALVKDWLPYSNNKSIAFEDANLVRDTMEISSIFIGDDSIWVGDNCPITSGQFVRVNFYDKKSKDTIKTQIGYEDELRIVTKHTHLIFYDTKKILIDPSSYKKYSLSETLNGKTFLTVLSLECSPADNCVSTGITKLYFSKSKGLAAYIRNGVLYTLK